MQRAGGKGCGSLPTPPRAVRSTGALGTAPGSQGAPVGAAPARRRERRGGNGDCGDGGDDDGDGGGVDGRGVACASRAQTSVGACVCAAGATSRDVHAWAGEGGRTIARVVALAVQEGPPSPVPGLGPVHLTGRAAHSRVHTLSGQPQLATASHSVPNDS